MRRLEALETLLGDRSLIRSIIRGTAQGMNPVSISAGGGGLASTVVLVGDGGCSRLVDALGALLRPGTGSDSSWVMVQKTLQALRAIVDCWAMEQQMVSSSSVDSLFARSIDGCIRALAHDRVAVRGVAVELLAVVMCRSDRPQSVLERVHRLCLRSSAIAGRLHGAEALAAWLSTVLGGGGMGEDAPAGSALRVRVSSARGLSTSAATSPSSGASSSSAAAAAAASSPPRFPIERIDLVTLRTYVTPLEGDAVGTVQAAARKVLGSRHTTPTVIDTDQMVFAHRPWLC